MNDAYDPDADLPAKVRDSIPARVAKGAALLDEERPGWEAVIDLSRLNIRSCGACVLGQVFGDYIDGLEFLEIADTFGEPNSASIPYGFCAGGREPWQIHAESLALAREWAGLVEKRREAREFGAACEAEAESTWQATRGI